MKKAIVLAVVAVALFLGHRYYDGSYAPVKRYKAFAEEVVKRHFDVASSMSDGLSADNIRQSGSQEKTGPGPEMFQTLFPSRFEIESQEKGDDGSVTIHAVQTVLFNPAGVESAVRPAMYATLRQVTKLHKAGGEWKIIAFDNKFEKMDTLSGR